MFCDNGAMMISCSLLYGAEPSISDEMQAASDEESDGDKGEGVFTNFLSQQKESRYGVLDNKNDSFV